MSLPCEHRAKLHSTNQLERLHGKIKRRTNVVGIFPNEDAITRLIGAILVEQNDEWAIQRARYMTLESITPMSNDDPHQAASRNSLSVPALPAGYRDERDALTPRAWRRSWRVQTRRIYTSGSANLALLKRGSPHEIQLNQNTFLRSRGRQIIRRGSEKG